MDEHLLTGLKVGTFHEDLPRSERDQGDGRCFLEGERLGLERHVVLVDRDELGERSRAQVAGPGVDLVTDPEVADVRPDLGDDAGHVVPEHERRLAFDQALELPVAGHLVQRVDACGAHSHQHVAWGDGRIR